MLGVVLTIISSQKINMAVRSLGPEGHTGVELQLRYWLPGGHGFERAEVRAPRQLLHAVV